VGGRGVLKITKTDFLGSGMRFKKGALDGGGRGGDK